MMTFCSEETIFFLCVSDVLRYLLYFMHKRNIQHSQNAHIVTSSIKTYVHIALAAWRCGQRIRTENTSNEEGRN
jgi:heme/copper-type cytochrome/quinol oxidase subunit 4